MKTTNIILTTLSTLPNNLQKNYYKVTISNQDYYCDGISQLEPGTKYFLQTQDIDEIIAIGSDQVINLNDDKKIKDDLNVHHLVDEFQYFNGNIEQLSPYGLYKYNIYRYITQQNHTVEQNISDVRRQEIHDIIKKTAKGIPQEAWLYQVDSKELRKAIQEDIEKNFVSEEEYRKYDQGQIDIIDQFEIKLEDYENKINELKNNKSIFDIVKEYRYMRYIDCVENKLENVKKKYNENQNLLYQKQIIEYRNIIQKLRYELDTLKTNRINNEMNYAKEYMYFQLDENLKMKPKSSNKNIDITFVPLRLENGVENINGLIHTILKNYDKVNIYMDVQGGSRTDGYVRNAVLSILNNDSSSHIQLKQVVSTDFERGKIINEIVDETIRYRINDLVSGMNAFINYGKADILNDYWKNVNVSKDDRVSRLIKYMTEVDNSLSLCDVHRLLNAMQEMNNIFQEESQIDNSYNNIFSVLEEGIKRDYGDIFNNETNEIDLLELIKWAQRKKFIQQAFTMIESLMPHRFVSDGVLCYCGKGEQYKNKVKQILITDIINHEKAKRNRKKKPNQKKSHNEQNKDKKMKNYQDWYFKDIDHFIFKFKFGLGDMINSFNKSQNQELKANMDWQNTLDLYYYGEKNKTLQLVKIYKEICDCRNTINHAAYGEVPALDEVNGMISRFISSYEAVCSTINKNNVNSCSISRDELMDEIEKKKLIVYNQNNNQNSNQSKRQNDVSKNKKNETNKKQDRIEPTINKQDNNTKNSIVYKQKKSNMLNILTFVKMNDNESQQLKKVLNNKNVEIIPSNLINNVKKYNGNQLILSYIDAEIKNMKGKKVVVMPIDFFNKCQEMIDVLNKYQCIGYVLDTKKHVLSEIIK